MGRTRAAQAFFVETARDGFGCRRIIPRHWAELRSGPVGGLLKPGQAMLADTYFDEARPRGRRGGEALDLVRAEGVSPSPRHAFNGNIDLQRLEQQLAARGPSGIALVLLTVPTTRVAAAS